MGRDLLKYKGIKRILLFITVLISIQSVAIILQAKWLAEAVTRLFNGEHPQRIITVILFFLGAFVIRHIVKLVMSKILDHYASNTASSARKEALEKVFSLGPRFVGKEGTGNLVTLMIEGVLQFRKYLELFLPKVIGMIVIPPAVLLYIWYIDQTSAVILLVTLPILIGFLILLGLAARKQANRQWGTHRLLSNHFVDSLRGLETLKYLGLSRKHSANIHDVSERYRKSTMGTLRVAFLSTFALDFFTMLSIATVAVFLGLRLVEGDLSLMPALTVLILAPEYFLPVRELGNDYHATLNGQEAGRRLLQMVKTTGFEEEEEISIPTWSPIDQIQINHLTVDHDSNGRKSLNDVTFSIQGMKKVGIIGESGSGKSTLIDILGGFLEGSEGSIQLNHQMCTHLKKTDWQNQLIYIPQHPHIFNDTLANNIRFYQRDASMEAVERAAEAAGLKKVIDRLPKGLEERIGDGGRSLSGGQAQRVAIARAFLEERPILLLDEPTAQLDIETEYEIKQKVLPLFKNKLVFMATHRLHWMLDMDVILMLDKGKLAEAGTHEELMLLKGAYYEMVQLQLEGVQ